MKLFCFGQGYTASRLCTKLSSTSWQYSGTGRSAGILYDGHAPIEEISKHLQSVTHVLISIPPNMDYVDSVFHHHFEDLRKLKTLKWLGYLSATSVYGDADGQWVDETSDTTPVEKRGALRLAAEKVWQNSELPIHIFRLGGIYGPERNQIDAVKSGRAKKIIKPGHYFSRVHVDDICAALLKSMESPTQGSIFNIVDDQPAPAADIIDYICDALDKPRLNGVSFDEADISPALRSFYKDNKRVSNKLSKRALNWKLKFPSYREGSTLR